MEKRAIYSYKGSRRDAPRRAAVFSNSIREKRGTIVVAIIGAIVTIESHYRGIM